MTLKLLTILFLLSPLAVLCQYTGGGNDGFAITFLPKTNITDDNAFRGGSDDGFGNTLLLKTNITEDNAFKGGADDGFANTFLSKTNITDATAFKGGGDDGFANTFLPKTNIRDATAFKGGNDDGFANIFLTRTNLTDATAFRGGNDDGFANTFLAKKTITDINAFRGGIGRGETQFKLVPVTCDGTTVTWNGSVSNAWENPDNWICGIMPNIGSIVIIPFGVPNYPRVNANFEIKTLFVNANASIVIMSGVLFKLNGQ